MRKKTPPATPWSNIDELINNGGNVSIGDIPPVPCAAVAADESIMLAALLRREGESLIELLGRLDDAIGKAFDEEFYTDEINA